MKEFAVTLRLYNNCLRQRRLELGMSQRDLAHAAGMSASAYNGLECMRSSPRNPKGGWTESATKVSEFHGLPLDDLFPATVHAIDQTTATAAFDLRELPTALLGEEVLALPPSTPEEECSARELKASIHRMLDGALTEKQALVLRKRNGIGCKPMSLQEIANEFDLSRERIRRIEQQALRELRHPSRSRELRVFLNDEMPIERVCAVTDDPIVEAEDGTGHMQPWRPTRQGSYRYDLTCKLCGSLSRNLNTTFRWEGYIAYPPFENNAQKTVILICRECRTRHYFPGTEYVD